MSFKKVLLVRKMSSLEYYYGGKHPSKEINESHESHNKKLELIESLLKKYNVEYKVVTRNDLSEELVNQYELVISAGGDGTVIAVASFNKDIPQLNIRTDEKSVGFLCHKEIEKTMENVLSGKFNIIEWTRGEVCLDGKFIGIFSNEVAIGENLKISQLSKYSLSFSKEGKVEKEKQGNSGLIITTGTGSTAWPAAFKPFPRESKFMRFRAIMPHFGKIDSGEANEITLIYLGHTGKFALDTVEHNLPRDSKLDIKISKHPLRVVELK